MKKRIAKHLSLNKETVRNLYGADMSGAAGGKMTGVSVVFCVTQLCSKVIDPDCNPNETMVSCPISDSIGC